MKCTSLIAAMLAAALLCACAGLPPASAPTMRLSADYEAAGDVGGMRAFVYGRRTVLEFPTRPLWLTVQDENGVVVPYEREGRYYRLARKLDRLTVRANARVVSVSAITPQTLSVPLQVPVRSEPARLAPPSKNTPPAIVSPSRADTQVQEQNEVNALLRLSAVQLDEARRAIAAGSGSAAEAMALNARLDRIKTQLVTASAVMVRMQFDTAATRLAADDQVMRTLVPDAKAAQRINIRGRTDARVAGGEDPRIALGRALAVRQFLVEQGVASTKIRVFALAAGDFLAPANTEAGRALNRRVEVELVDHRYAELTQQAGALQATSP